MLSYLNSLKYKFLRNNSSFIVIRATVASPVVTVLREHYHGMQKSSAQVLNFLLMTELTQT